MGISTCVRRAATLVVAAALTPLCFGPALAQSYYDEDDYGPSRVARLSYSSGEVAVLAPGESSWERIDVNAPLFEGYEIYADRDARAEIALGGDTFLRIADGADVTLTQFEEGWAILDVTAGTVALSVGERSRNQHYSLSAPAAAVSPQGSGVYRVDVADNGDTWVTVNRGTAEIATLEGSFDALEGDLVSLSYERPEDIDLIGNAMQWNRDPFDRWGDERDDYYAGLYDRDIPGPVNALFGRDDIFGLAELALHGTWLALSGSTFGWQPREARNPDWSPYQEGYWDYSAVTGWTWISNEEWGWAPYHYGRWNYDDRHGWAWVPTHGDSATLAATPRGRYRWKPALVYMWQPRGEDSYAWVPLAPGERYVPFSSPSVTASATAPRRPAVDPTFRPRHLRDRRGVVAIQPNALLTRQRPQRITATAAERVAPATAEPPRQLAELPKPSRGPAVAAPARVKPPEAARRRAVVVDPTVAAAAPRAADPAKRAERAERRTVRQTRQAERREIRMQRKTAAEAGVVQPAQPTTTARPTTPAATADQPQPGRRGGRKAARAAGRDNAPPDAAAPRGRRNPPVTTAEPTTTEPAPVDRQPANRGRRNRPNTTAPPATAAPPAETAPPAAEPVTPEADETPGTMTQQERRRQRREQRAKEAKEAKEAQEKKEAETTPPADADAPPRDERR